MPPPAAGAPPSAGRIVLVTPPFVQLSAPAAATPFLAGALRAAGWTCGQYDLSIDCALRLFCRDGLERAFAAMGGLSLSRAAKPLYHARRRYIETIDAVIAFLQGRNAPLAWRIVGRQWLPEGPRFASLEQIAPQFGDLETGDGARLLASLYLDDLSELLGQTVLPGYALSKYQEGLAASAPSFDPLLRSLAEPDNLLDAIIGEAVAAIDLDGASLVGITVPFPGNFLAALMVARALRRRAPAVPLVLGGGYVSTELRELGDGRLFDWVDWLCLDDGVAPLLALAERQREHPGSGPLERTGGLVRSLGPDGRGGVARHGFDAPAAPPAELAWAAPDFGGLDHGRYLGLLETPNPMHRLWSERGFFKLRMAEGCYWRRCAFCDTSLDYIARYRPVPTGRLVEQVRAVQAATGLTGIHFVDEAMPAAFARRFALSLAEENAEGGLPPLVWWGNVRYDRSFGAELARDLAAGGCVGVSGGMEGVHPRLLAAMDKGAGIHEMVGALAAFADAGIMTHAYLIHGFPSTSVQETVDALEIIRQCFARGILHSAFWHRFSLTMHSPAGRDPGRYGLVPQAPAPGAFARNDLGYEAPDSPDTDWMAAGLRTAVYNWMNGVGLELPARDWFGQDRRGRPLAPATSLAPDFVRA